MPSRRLILAGLAAVTALAPAADAQGKKNAGTGDSTDRLIGIDGHYLAKGLNADGTAYAGTADIVQQGDAVECTWIMGEDVIHGQGVIEGRVITVDWGGKTPVIYVAMPDGELHGTWQDGTALEKLIPD